MITIINGTTREESIAKLKEMVANERPISVRWVDFMDKGDYAFDKATMATTAVAICDMPEGANPILTLVAHVEGIWLPFGKEFKRIRPKIFITTEYSPVLSQPKHFQIIKP
jgi:hypothetical protein